MRVGIVNDMKMSMAVISRVVSMDPECQIAWTACNGAEAVRCCVLDLPDLVVMDLFMPVMDGTEATRRIMAATPCPVLIVTASVDANSSKVFETLGAGALDAVRTPVVDASGNLGGSQPLLKKIAQFKQLAKSSIFKQHPKPSEDVVRTSGIAAQPKLVVLGASTGGPNALADLLSQIPENCDAAFVVIQHVDRQFAPGLATWLNSLCFLEVKVARAGDVPQRGIVLVAATNDHLVMNADRVLQYTAEPEDNPFRPSADVFFSSVAAHSKEKGIAALLTGIGRDGAIGLLKLKEAGWLTFAQSKESCVVYGMPKAAAEMGAAQEILSPKDIGIRLACLLARRGGR